jgi:TRAP-type C4-dicarboxylate transport system permease small subunit
VLAQLEAKVEDWSRRVAMLGVTGFVAVALVTIADVLMRWLFNSPVDGLEEVNRLVVAVATACFFPLAIAERHHIAITFLGSALGQLSGAWLRALASVATTLFFVLVGWQFINFVLQMQDAGETTWILAWPVTPWWIAVTVILLTCVPAQLIVLVADFAHALAGGAPETGEGSPETAQPSNRDS